MININEAKIIRVGADYVVFCFANVSGCGALPPSVVTTSRLRKTSTLTSPETIQPVAL